MSSGYIVLSREVIEHPLVCKDKDYLAVMMYLIRNAAYAEHLTVLSGKTIKLMPGQLVTGRQKMAEETGAQQHKIDRILKCYESAHLIEQQSNNHGRLITLLFWNSESKSEQQDEQQVSSNCAASEQQLSTTEIKNKRNKELKEKRVSKDTLQKKTQTSLVEESSLPDDLKPKVIEWLKYKSEKNQGYKETGLKALLTQVGSYASSYGTDVVSNRITEAMASGWQGINLDKMNARAAPRAAPMGSYDPDLQRQAEENFRRMMEARNAVRSG